MTSKTNEKELARTLYFETNQTQAEIAETLNINPKTLYLWMQEGEWRRLKQAARQAPAIVVDDLYEQLTELNNSIRSRPAGNRFPTREEAEISRKLILSIDKIKKQATLSDNIQVMKSFTSYLNSINPKLAKEVILIADDFIKGRAKDDYRPYDMAYRLEDYPQEQTTIDELSITEEEPHLSTSEVQEEVSTTQNETVISEEPIIEEQPENKPIKYREGVYEIHNPNLPPGYTKELKVGNITIRFGQMLTKASR